MNRKQGTGNGEQGTVNPFRHPACVRRRMTPPPKGEARARATKGRPYGVDGREKRIATPVTRSLVRNDRLDAESPSDARRYGCGGEGRRAGTGRRRGPAKPAFSIIPEGETIIIHFSFFIWAGRRERLCTSFSRCMDAGNRPFGELYKRKIENWTVIIKKRAGRHKKRAATCISGRELVQL